MKTTLAVTILSLACTMCLASEGSQETPSTIDEKMEEVQNLRSTADRNKKELKTLEVRLEKRRIGELTKAEEEQLTKDIKSYIEKLKKQSQDLEALKKDSNQTSEVNEQVKSLNI